MSALTVELGEAAVPHPCKCCGETTHMVYGLVYHEGSAHAVYFAGWSEGHRDEGLRLAVSIGDWGNDSGPDDRVAIGLSARLVKPQVLFDVVAPEDSPWGSYELIGPMLPKDEAAANPYLEAYLDVARQVVRDDGRARRFLKQLAAHA